MTNLLFNYFADSNERIIGRKPEMRGYMIKCGEMSLEGGSTREASHERSLTLEAFLQS